MSPTLENMDTKQYVELLKSLTPLQVEAICGICAAIAAGTVLREHKGLSGPQLAARVAKAVHAAVNHI